jgi:thioredoxin 1
MKNDKKENMFKKYVVKITIIILIIIAIGTIWFVKNSDQQITKGDSIANNANTEIIEDFALHVTDKLDIEHLKSYGLPIIIDFGADSCIPCKEMAPVLEKLNEELQGKAIIRFVDVWQYQELSEEYPISVIPTQVLFDKSGNPYVPKDLESSQMNMYSLKDTNEHVFTTHEGGMTEEMMIEVLKEMGMEE